ncbi:hypothetical protein [Pseudostreptobacillus sp.]
MKKFLKPIIFTLFAFTIFISCGEPKSKQSLVTELESIRNENIVTADNELAKGMDGLIKKFEYSINNVNQEKDKSEIDVHMKRVDLEVYMKELLNEIIQKSLSEGLTEEKMNVFAKEYFEKLGQEKELKYVEKDLKANMSKVDGKWVLNNKEDFVNFVKEFQTTQQTEQQSEQIQKAQ